MGVFGLVFAMITVITGPHTLGSEKTPTRQWHCRVGQERGLGTLVAMAYLVEPRMVWRTRVVAMSLENPEVQCR